MDTRSISAVMAIAAYQLPQVREFPAPVDAPDLPTFQPADSVEISEEARRQAAEASSDLHLWGEVRYDPPHTDDPDFPWEVAHQQWMELMDKVFGTAPADGASEPASAADAA